MRHHSIVIPVHNEAANLQEFVTTFIGNLPSDVQVVEIILVENGSRDATLTVCEGLRRAWPETIRVISIQTASYGEAIKAGILASTGTHVSVLECDFLEPDFLSLCDRLFEGGQTAFVVASKRHPASIDARPFKRRLLTAGYNRVLLGWCLGYPGSDTHGLKSIEGVCARRLCASTVTSGEVFQTELVLLAWRLGIRIHEVPIIIREKRTAPVSVMKRVPKVLNTIIQLRRSLSRFPPASHSVETVSSGRLSNPR
jgi:glycosyltransferase involved in cell wall biosynthesis